MSRAVCYMAHSRILVHKWQIRFPLHISFQLPAPCALRVKTNLKHAPFHPGNDHAGVSIGGKHLVDAESIEFDRGKTIVWQQPSIECNRTNRTAH